MNSFKNKLMESIINYSKSLVNSLNFKKGLIYSFLGNIYENIYIGRGLIISCPIISVHLKLWYWGHGGGIINRKFILLVLKLSNLVFISNSCSGNLKNCFNMFIRSILEINASNNFYLLAEHKSA